MKSESLRMLFQEPGLDWLLERLVRRIERGSPLDTGSLIRKNATTDERRAIDDLFGRRSSSGQSLNVNLKNLISHLAIDASVLRSVVIALRGPISKLRESREIEAGEWNRLFARWKKRIKKKSWATNWIEGLEKNGQLKRAVGREVKLADELLCQAWTILDPASHDEIFLASLAAKITGDSHALDRGEPLSSLCLRAIFEREGIDGNTTADKRRQAWASLGVTVDDLSAPVLCLNLRATSGSDAAPWIDWHVARGEPFFLPWRQVRGFDPDPEMGTVFVCENPAIVSEAATRLGSHSRPLICTNGIPSTTVKFLLKRLAERSLALRLRADFDWAGIKIIDQLHISGHSELWRMTAEDYRRGKPSQALTGKPHTPTWLGDLGKVMKKSGMAVYEEELIDFLITDLRL
ncbi:MAG: TIGR02679 family protein [Verrucomicrobiales bacterium]|nr:TIGR02679 family protein [Verrucomicrobiales bacterium]